MAASVRGRVGLAEAVFPCVQAVAPVVLADGRLFSVHFESRNGTFQILDSRGETLALARAKGHGFKRSWELGNEAFRLTLIVGITGPQFVTESGTIAACLSARGAVRALTMDGMEFMHRDYRSEIEFRGPEERLLPAILAAYVLFNEPTNTETDSTFGAPLSW